jgi:hypothetical protein
MSNDIVSTPGAMCCDAVSAAYTLLEEVSRSVPVIFPDFFFFVRVLEGVQRSW